MEDTKANEEIIEEPQAPRQPDLGPPDPRIVAAFEDVRRALNEIQGQLGRLTYRNYMHEEKLTELHKQVIILEEKVSRNGEA